MQPVNILPVKDSGNMELETMQLHIEDLIFRWVQAGAPIIPSMKDSIERITKDDNLQAYFWERLRPKFYT
ncbi:MAG: hypothetical protein HOK63_07020 [Thaumarchaeota archaeon]|jgi:hypothetical protein|nr:hypothetical protein [Nitrososphaerota archaeon]MBT5842539.1 hypothetical protein [Nitrososphaerota archaeon]MBT6469379.1 hypothetical protein [Nitrososphaerota archaeon]